MQHFLQRHLNPKTNRLHLIIALLLVSVVIGLCSPDIILAKTAKDTYTEADRKYSYLKKNPRLQKYRDKWFACIDLFKDVYRKDPDGPWAAAGMYKTGELYYELYKKSYKPSDKAEALDTFQRVIKRYPNSRYNPKAKAFIAAIRGNIKPLPKKNTQTQARLLEKAEKCYQNLLKNARLQKYRDRWFSCIDKYKAAHSADPNGPHAAEAMYRSGILTYELYKRSYASSDKANALALLNKTVQSYPDSSYGRASAKKVAAITGKPMETGPADVIQQVIAESEASPPEDKQAVPLPTGSHTLIQGLRHWSNPSYTRIVIDADKETSYRHRLLNQDPSINKPKRLYVDLDHSRLGEDFEKVVPINDNLLSNVRAGQHTSRSVRVVVDIKSFKTYKIFSLRNPFRIVIDVWGIATASGPPASTGKDIHQDKGKVSPGSLAKQLALGVSKIVIDPGHGGRDYGAPGYYKGVHEKKIVLSLAKKLAQKIRTELGCNVVLTRETDTYLTLEERTAIANTNNADLFISIHTNSARDRRAFGLETFFLNLATDDEAIRVAAFENATSEKNISDLQTILTDLMQNAKINESSRLAAHVQSELFQHMKKSYNNIKSKGVKQAPFYVLLGAQMPAILIETSFISNPRECKRLTDTRYQDKLCEGIIKGIREYIKETNPTALLKIPPNTKVKG
ncbi:N-acetylmuramoyl-L-alanine amidase [Thermodesulfobacteriota bacterium]